MPCGEQDRVRGEFCSGLFVHLNVTIIDGVVDCFTVVSPRAEVDESAIDE